MYFEKELQKIDQTEFRIEKVIERKVDKLFVKWKGCDNLFNSWIDLKKYSNMKWGIFSNHIIVVKTK